MISQIIAARAPTWLNWAIKVEHKIYVRNYLPNSSKYGRTYFISYLPDADNMLLIFTTQRDKSLLINAT